MLPTFSPDLARSAREHAGLSQQETADRAQLTKTTVQNVEAGRRDPMGYVLAALASVYGVTIDSFYVHGEEGAITSDAGGETHDGEAAAVEGSPPVAHHGA